MKKISTLAVALITMGSLATSARAAVVPTETLPSGYYKITSAAFKTADQYVYGYMFSDYFLDGNTNHATLLAKTYKDDANNYIWKITNDGQSASFGIVNGQGTSIKREDGGLGSYKYAVHSTLTPLLGSGQSDLTTGTYLFSEYLNAPGTGDPNHYYGGQEYKAVALWNNQNGPTTKWKLEKLNISDENVYTVSISGGNDDCYLTRTLTDGSEVAFNGGFFVSTTTNPISESTSFTALALDGFTSSVSVNSTAKTISVTYVRTLETLKNLITSAKELLNKRGVGYPTTTSYDYGALSSKIAMAEAVETEDGVSAAYTALQEQMVTYSAAKNAIQMPEDGKVYRIYALWADGTKVYAVNDGKTTAKNSKYYTSGSKTEPQDNKGLWVVQKVGDGNYNIASAVADRLFTYVQGANGTKNAITKICPSAGKTIGRIKLGADAGNVHIVMNKDGSKMDQYTNTQTDTGDWCTEWVFEEVSNFAGQTVNFAASTDGKNYATLNLPYASKIPTGVTAYKVGSVVDSELNLETYKNEGEVLPVNTPVLLIANKKGEKSFAPAAYAAAEVTGFEGTLAATAVNAEHTYILSKNGGDTVKFFALDSEGNTVNANKAYLVVPAASAAQALSFNFGNTATSIQNAAAEGISANAPLFDLSGRRVVKAVKGGIYIQNGKKFVK